MKLFLIAVLCFSTPAFAKPKIVYDDTAIASVPNPMVADDIATMAVYHAPIITADAAAPSSPVLSMAASFLGDHLGALLTFLLSIPAISGALSLRNKRRLSLAIYHAFMIVEYLDDDDAVAGKLDKEKAGLKYLNDYMAAHGWRPPKPGDVEVAKLEFKSLNAQTDAKLALAAVPPQAPTKA